MWTCPKCNRSFKVEDQNHYCIPVGTIDHYIAEQPEAYQVRLEQVRQAILEVAPQAKQCIKWQMPTFVLKENLIHFAFNKNHLGIYPGEEAVRFFKNELDVLGLSASKGSIRIPWSEELPLDLIRRITRHRLDVLGL